MTIPQQLFDEMHAEVLELRARCVRLIEERDAALVVQRLGDERVATVVVDRIAQFILQSSPDWSLMDHTDPNCPVGVTLTQLAKAIRDGEWRGGK